MSKLQDYRFPFARYPGIRNALLLILGIVLASDFGVRFYPGFLLGCGLVYLLVLFFEKSSFSPALVQIVNLMQIIIVVIFGAALWTKSVGESDEIRMLLDGFSGKEIEFAGVFTRVDPVNNGFQSLFMDVDSIRAGDDFFPLSSKIQLRRSTDDLGEEVVFESGHYAVLTVEIRDFPRVRNPGGFDTGSWLMSMGIQGVGMVKHLADQHSYQNRWSWIWWRTAIENQIDKTVSAPNVPLVKAVLLGNKTGLDAGTKTEFSRAGLSHLMAVSGMHVGFVLMPIWLIIPLFWVHKIGRPIGLGIVIFVLFGYAGITGFTSSVSRASITAALLATGKLFQFSKDSVNTTGIAAIMILGAAPESLFQIGFQLSFCAVLVILILGPVLRDWIPARIRYTWKGSFIQFLGISTIVQAGLFPILAINFGEFSIAGPIANMIGIPLTQALFLWSMSMLPISFMVHDYLPWIMAPVDWMAAIMILAAEVVGNSDFAWIEVKSLSSWTPVIWVMMIGFAGTLTIPGLRLKWGIMTLVFVFLSQLDLIYSTLKSPELEVVVLDVGQGDAVFIRTPAGRTILYDTGIWSPYTNSGRAVIVPYLKYRNIDTIDAVILSHPHADHIGGIMSILEEIEVGAMYHSGFFYDSGIYNAYIDESGKRGIPLHDVRAGDFIDVDPSIRIMTLHPGTGNYGSNPNDWSVSMKLIYGETSFLFTGDAEEEAERQIVENYGELLASDWLKAGHHGSKSSSSALFLNTVKPDYVAVSLGYRNRYRHPHAEAAKSLNDIGAEIKYTSLNGALVYFSDGKTVRSLNGN